ncbi:MAG: NUDIX hydrolase [Methanomassiliicoccales archaeon]
MYSGSEFYSIVPHFDLHYKNALLLTHAEAESLLAGRLGEVVENELNLRAGRLGLGKLMDGGKLTETGERVMAIYRNKKQLANEQLIHRWKSPSVAADSIVCVNDTILLVKRRNDPYKGRYVLPGGILEEHETLEECAVRELREETGIDGKVVALLSVHSDPSRDPRVRMISAIYVVEPLHTNLTAGDDAAEAVFMPIDSLPPLAFDHDMAIEEFVKSPYFRHRG